MRAVVLVAIAAAIGNALQGWDNSNIAGAVMYIKEEFNLQNNPTVEGLIVAMSLIGGTTITTLSGPLSDSLGRRPMLTISAIFFFLSGLVMMWSPNVYVLLFARLLDGFGTGLAITLVPVYISETAPSDIRGQLNTLPQFTGSSGMFISYCMVFGMSLMSSPNWRLMLGFISLPSFFFFLLTLFYLPESPRWLVSKGRMLEAKQVLQRLRGHQDVTAELGLLVEGLGTNGETSLEEYLLSSTNNHEQLAGQKDQQLRLLYGPDQEGSTSTWIAKPVKIGNSTFCGAVSDNIDSAASNRSVPRKDPLVSLFGSIHEKASESLLSPYLGSILNINGVGERHQNRGQWDFESQKINGEEFAAGDADSVDSDDNNLRSPLLSSCRMLSGDKEDIYPPFSSSSASIVQANAAATNGGAIGGGWQLAWKWSEKEGEDGKKEGVMQRLYLHNVPASQRGSIISVSGAELTTEDQRDMVHAAALVSQSTILDSKNLLSQQFVEDRLLHPKENLVRRTNNWKGLLEPGVKRALVVGIGLQILQQASGINGVLYFAPQILEQAGVPLLLANMGISSASASLLISTLTTLLMLPCIGVSIWLMDIAGRRCLLLSTIPILIVSLGFLVAGSMMAMGGTLKATILTGSLVVYVCCFVMSFGVIPNILCAEIFPTQVRGLCIGLCSMVYWIGNMAVTYSFPVMLKSMGLAGVFGIYAGGCVVSWIFVYLKVPETKGMPLEVISDFSLSMCVKSHLFPPLNSKNVFFPIHINQIDNYLPHNIYLS